MIVIDSNLNETYDDFESILIEESDKDGETVYFCARKSDPYNPVKRDKVFAQFKADTDLYYNTLGTAIMAAQGLQPADATSKQTLISRALSFVTGGRYA